MNIDIHAGLVDNFTNDLAAAADDVANLVHINGDRLYTRRIRREFFRRLINAFQHLAKDKSTPLLRLCQSGGENIPRDARDLDIHLNRSDSLCRSRNLKVHIAECVFHALYIRQNGIIVAVPDEPHGDTGNRALNRNPRAHQRERTAADAAHRTRSVRLQNLRNKTYRIGEILNGRNHREQGAFSERTVSNFTASRTAHGACFTDAVPREIIMMQVVFRGLRSQTVDDLLVADRAERRYSEHLCLTACKKPGAVRPR